MAPVLGYWNIRGLAEPIRILLHYVGEKFDNKFYVCGPAPNYDRSQWFNEKEALGLDFPNLPYYIDGDFKITQSSAILEYLAEKYKMVPSCAKRRAVLHMIQGEVMDFRSGFASMCYGSVPNTKQTFIENMPKTLERFEKCLGDKEWLSGEKISYPDFCFAELLNVLVKFDPKCLDNFPKLRAYLRRFEELPAVKEYMSTKEFKTRACNNVAAWWRGDS